MNFLNALERIPKLVEQYKAQNVTYERDIPILQETVGGVWKKEDELKALKGRSSGNRKDKHSPFNCVCTGEEICAYFSWWCA